jgi:hypothetical protein
MPRKTEPKDAGNDRVRLPEGSVLKPPVSVEDLRADTEQDPDGAEEFVALIRALRNESPRPMAL